MIALTRVNEIQAKSILTKSGLPGATWVVNCYNGCQYGCMYCYAAQIARWKHPKEEWGSFLDVKVNAPNLLKKELPKASGLIFFSSVTDPYTGLEAKYHLTRQCLQVLADANYQGGVGIQTKSPLITQDINILKKLKNLSVGFTVTTLDDKVSRFLEVTAPPVSARFDALQKLHDEGIYTYAFIGPLLPYFVNSEDKINDLLDGLEKVGVTEVWFEHINLSSKIKARLYDYLKIESPELIPEFDHADIIDYRQKLEKIITKAMKNRPLKMGLDKIIYHKDLPKKK